MTYALKALALTLILSILLTGALAVHLTSVYASFNISFGTPPAVNAPSVPLVDMASLAPLPLRKPSLKK